MSRLGKLFYRELFFTFTATFLAFFIIVFTVDLFENVDSLIKLRLPDTVRFFALRIPFHITQIMPYSAIISSLITLNIMSQKHELTALLSLGFHVRGIFAVMLGFVLAVSLINFANDGFFAPRYLLKSEKMSPKGKGMSLTNLSNISDVVIKTDTGFTYIDLIIPPGNMLMNTYVAQIKDNVIEEYSFAPVVAKENDRWIARNARRVTVRDNKVSLVKELELPENSVLKDFSSVTYQPQWLTVPQVWRIIRSGVSGGFDIRAHSFQLSKKLLHLFSPLLIFFLLFPFGFQLSRNKKNVEIIFTGMIVLIGYFVFETFLFRILQSSGLNPAIPPLVSLTLLALAGAVTWKKQFFWNRR